MIGNHGGRPPKPTALHILRGTFRKDRHGGKNEPEPERKAPRCPKHITGERRHEWHRVCKELLAMGVVALPDRVAIEKYTFWYATWLKVSQELEEGITKIYKRLESGYPMLDPRITLANTASDKIDRFLTEFGCTPGSRTRIRIEQKKPLDAFEEFRRRKYIEQSKP